ncbi:MAG: MBL fold metallo-hydrolase [Burkholderiaceae bacterium]
MPRADARAAPRPAAPALPDSMHVIERDWLSSNQVLFFDGAGAEARASLVDTGYVKHAELTLALVRHVLARRGLPERALTRVLNTHLHSDHCGGNAALAREFGCRVLVPAAELDAVARWDEEALTYASTGQRCERFTADGTLHAGERLELGGAQWEVLAAPGHDPHSLMLYCAEHRGLVSADALWENGFGVIFPEVYGDSGFAEQQAVLELIATLDVDWVVPGHGRVFGDVPAALERAFARLKALRGHPSRNARNALKVLLKFQMLDRERVELPVLYDALRGARFIENAAGLMHMSVPDALDWAIRELVKQSQLARDGDTLLNHEPSGAASA